MVSNMTQNHRMSFIIPTYQEEKYIEKTLEALSMHNCEIIVVDSGHDKTFNIAQNMQTKFSNLIKREYQKQETLVLLNQVEIF